MSHPDGRVTVWVAGLDVGAARLTALRGLLDHAERERERRLRHPLLRARFAAAHGLRREILAAVTGVAAAELRFTHEDKPALAGGHPQFSASRSTGLAVLAVADGAVGVDVERVRPGFGYDEIVQAFFRREDREPLERLPVHERPHAFFSTWTRYEASAKLRGVGLAAHLEAPEPPTWMRSVSVAPGFVATLAGGGSERAVTVARWNEVVA